MRVRNGVSLQLVLVGRVSEVNRLGQQAVARPLFGEHSSVENLANVVLIGYLRRECLFQRT